MIDVRRAADRYRGGDDAAGIDTRHAFSFSGFYDPGNVRFGLLVACNEERLAPGAGFAEHAHRDTEIVTWVVEGSLEHRESGRVVRLDAGDAQLLSAGSGVRHVEANAGAGPLRFLQMWLHPGGFGEPPGYAAATGPVPAGPGLTLLAGAGPGAPLPLRQPAATLWAGRPSAPDEVALPPARFGYVHVLAGTVHLAGEALGPGDAARLTDEPSPALTTPGPAEYVYWAMNAEPSFG
ncbi:pirin family protein [Streptomyces sp. NRRL F-5123]|uniref:pirin family protein n=1 Tax=Streptomyces sp. NRRL F-5123 TaxID=1463856 RepID=UPI0004E2666B|nr:pirin family protein [Streptomyces sp. NRRL F-5123]